MQSLHTVTEGMIKVLRDLDKEEGKTLSWTTFELGVIYVNMFMISYNSPLTDKVIERIVLDKAKDPMAESVHYKEIQKLIERKLK